MKKIYFLCIGNSSRSQIAEGYTKAFGSKFLDVKSGGTKPASRVSSKAIKVMAEDGIDISLQKPKQMDKEYAKSSDLVIIMGCGAEKMCPAWVVSKSENWNLDDPKDQDLDFYRNLRDEIKNRVTILLNQIKRNNL